VGEEEGVALGELEGVGAPGVSVGEAVLEGVDEGVVEAVLLGVAL
jgi:hypothetical protein